jgi:hypothetical protein
MDRWIRFDDDSFPRVPRPVKTQTDELKTDAPSSEHRNPNPIGRSSWESSGFPISFHFDANPSSTMTIRRTLQQQKPQPSLISNYINHHAHQTSWDADSIASKSTVPLRVVHHGHSEQS